jgi:hypothetical protein
MKSDLDAVPSFKYNKLILIIKVLLLQINISKSALLYFSLTCNIYADFCQGMVIG